MPKRVLLDVWQLSVFVPAGISKQEDAAIRRAFKRKRIVAKLEKMLGDICRRHRSLAKVRFAVTW